jgi:hypothetical protein
MNTQNFEGYITLFTASRQIGTISSRDANGKIRQFFFHTARIISSDVELRDVGVGMFVRFDISTVPVKQGNLPTAINIELSATGFQDVLPDVVETDVDAGKTEVA